MSLAIVIMAAGQSQRFGGCKPLALLQGKPLLQHAIDAALGIESADIYIVTGRWHTEIINAQQQGELSQEIPCWFNPRWSEGLGQSINYAFNRLGDQYQHVLVMLADQVMITSLDLEQLLLVQDVNDVCCAKYHGKRGVPAIFSQACFPALRNLSGDTGAKALLYDEELSVVEIEMESAGIDVDTSEELSVLSKFSSVP